MDIGAHALSSLSTGVQCELGQESYRNCLSMKVESVSPGTAVAHCQNGDFDPKNENNLQLQNVSGRTEESSKQDCPSHPQTQFVCGNCDKIFSVSEDLENHCLVQHNRDTPFKCHQCLATFSCWHGSQGLKVHLETHLHPSCSTVICKLEDSEKHNVELDSLAPTDFSNIEFCELVCGDCGLQYPDTATYETHCKAHDPTEPFKCIECSLRFKRCLTIEEHRASHLLVKPYSCVDCGKEYSFKWSLLMHTQIIHGLGPRYHCVKCGLGFLNVEFFSGHAYLHSVKEYSVEIDLKSVNAICMTVKNGEVSDKISSAILECEECELEFPTEADLAMHSHIHEGPQTFKCEQCQKECDSYAELKQHVNTNHSDVEMQWCEDCGGCGYLNIPLSGDCTWLNLENGDGSVCALMPNTESVHDDTSSDVSSDASTIEGEPLKKKAVLTTRSKQLGMSKTSSSTQKQNQSKKKVLHRKGKASARKESTGITKARREVLQNTKMKCS